MKARLVCRNVRSVRWAVKKVPTQIKMKYDKSRVIVVISKSSFLPEEQERRISRGYCRYDRPNNLYLYIYMLGQGPNPRTSSNLRMGKHCHECLH